MGSEMCIRDRAARPPVGRDVRRSRRLTGFRPAGRPPLPAAAKEAKRRRGCPAVALWLQRCHPRTPGIYGGPILGVYRPLSGAGGTTTAPASAPLPLSVRNQDGLVCWAKQARLIAQVLISAAVNWRAGQNTRPYKAISVGTVSLPRLVPTSRGRECRSGCAGRIRPPRTVTPVGRDDSARRLTGFRSPVYRHRTFHRHPVGEGLAPSAVRLCCDLPGTL